MVEATKWSVWPSHQETDKDKDRVIKTHTKTKTEVRTYVAQHPAVQQRLEKLDVEEAPPRPIVDGMGRRRLWDRFDEEECGCGLEREGGGIGLGARPAGAALQDDVQRTCGSPGEGWKVGNE